MVFGKALQATRNLWSGSLKHINNISGWMNRKIPGVLKHIGTAQGILSGAARHPSLEGIRPYVEAAQGALSGFEKATQATGDITKKLERGSEMAQRGLGAGYMNLYSGATDIGKNLMNLRRYMTSA